MNLGLKFHENEQYKVLNDGEGRSNCQGQIIRNFLRNRVESLKKIPKKLNLHSLFLFVFNYFGDRWTIQAKSAGRNTVIGNWKLK